MNSSVLNRFMTRSIALVLLAGGIAIVGAESTSAQAAGPGTAQLTATIDAILADPALEGAHAGVVVVNPATGETLYNREGDIRLMPASNTKLLTSAAAMESLGTGYRFTTDVRRVAGDDDLYLRGTGDPTMLASDYKALAASVAQAGMTTIEGDLVADDTWFDKVRLGNSWNWDDEANFVAAPVSALTISPDTTYNSGSVIVAVTPGAAAGAAAGVALAPETGALKVVNTATTVASGGSLTVTRQHGTNTIVVSGSITVGAAADRRTVAVDDPTAVAADVFRRALAAQGVTVKGDIVTGGTPSSATVVASRRSMTLGELAIPFLKLSNNNHAELLTKALGRKVSNSGTWSAGLAAITTYLRSVGVDPATLRQVDGSGLSRRNFVPPLALAKLLVAARAEPWFTTWYNALPVAGNPATLVGGTLASRMRGTPAADNVHAKTGTLTGASALSGYVTDADGDLLVFSIVMNFHIPAVTALQDQIAIALATHTASTSVNRRSVPIAPPVPAAPEGLECSWVEPIAC
jgi:D-alanyl-D-alanine carboxypeptidase/D-alanyl-D-alanine-endopeptidase (penicillin-binding protein 4)